MPEPITTALVATAAVSAGLSFIGGGFAVADTLQTIEQNVANSEFNYKLAVQNEELQKQSRSYRLEMLRRSLQDNVGDILQQSYKRQEQLIADSIRREEIGSETYKSNISSLSVLAGEAIASQIQGFRYDERKSAYDLYRASVQRAQSENELNMANWQEDNKGIFAAQSFFGGGGVRGIEKLVDLGVNYTTQKTLAKSSLGA